MDHQTLQENQSDSDSSESWTFVDETAPKLAEEALEVSSTSDENVEKMEAKEAEEDTDGVAVITDDEEVTSTLGLATKQTPPPNYQSVQFVTLPKSDPETSCAGTFLDREEELPTDFYIPNRKIKSYYHKRNNHVSSLLNFVLLGALIIASTLAIGFTWGINDDTCSLNVLDSVNGILANLQKLQRENELLKSKIRILRSMKHNTPIQKDIDFDKYLDYHMHLEQQKMIPKYDVTPDIINPDYQIIVESGPGSPNKPTIDVIGTSFGEDNQLNGSYPVKNNVKKHNLKMPLKPLHTTSKSSLEGDNAAGDNTHFADNQQPNQRFKREESIYNNDKHHSPKYPNVKSFCDDPTNANDIEYNKKCSNSYKQNNEVKVEKQKRKDEYKLKGKNLGEKYKSTDDESEKFKGDKYGSKKYKKTFDTNEKVKSKDVQKEKKHKPYFNPNENYKITKDQEQYENVSDWYQKMYDGRQEIREKGFDEYDLLDMKNKAKWYFNRMNEREKSRWKGGDRYKRHLRREYFKNRS